MGILTLIVIVGIVYFALKISKLETRISAIEKNGSIKLAPAKSQPQPIIQKPQPLVAPTPVVNQTMAQPVATKSVSQAVPKIRKSITEEQIGKEWFNKIGAVAIVFGIVLFIGYTFQYLGPLGKILIGLAVSFGLIIGGWLLIKKYKQYAEIVMALGWSLLYFTTYAAHYIEASQVIQSANLSMLLLFGVASALTVFAYWYNSEHFGIFSVFLGALSTVLSPVPFISLIGITILSFAAVAITVLRNWATVGFFAVIASYLSYAVALARQGTFLHYETFVIGSEFLVIYFLIYLVASFLVNPGTYKQQQYHPAFIATNTVGFFVLFMVQLYKFYPAYDGYTSAILGVVLLIVALLAKVLQKDKYIFLTYFWLSWGFLTLAVPLQLVGQWIAAVWLVEGAALVLVGLYTKRQKVLLAGGMALFLFLVRFITFDILMPHQVMLGDASVSSRTITSIFTIAVFTIIYLAWELQKSKLEKNIADLVVVPLFVATGLTTLILCLEGSKNLLGLYLLLQAIILYSAGLFFDKNYLRFAGLLPGVAYVLRVVLYDLYNTTPLGTINYRTITSIVGATGLYLSYLLSYTIPAKFSDNEKFVRDYGFATAATLLLMGLIYFEATPGLRSVLLLIYGVILYAVGLTARQENLRTISMLPVVGYFIVFLTYDLQNKAIINETLNYRTVSAVLGAAGFYLLYALGHLLPERLSEQEKTVGESFAAVATGILTIFVFVELEKRVVTLGWSVIGTVALLAGFAFKQRILRLSGMAVLLLAILRVFIFDLSFLDTIYRIVSFIVLGAVLMGVSFLYTKYKDKLLA